MARNIKQVYDTNPSTTLTTGDLMYLGKFPYGLTNDSAIKIEDIFNSSPVTDNTLPRFNGTSGYKLQSSTAIVNDDGSINVFLTGGVNAGGTLGSHSIGAFLGNYSSGSVNDSYGSISVHNDFNKDEGALFGAYRVGASGQAWLSMGIRTSGTDIIQFIQNPDGDAAIAGNMYSQGFQLSNNPLGSITSTPGVFAWGAFLQNTIGQFSQCLVYDPGQAQTTLPQLLNTTSGLMAQTSPGLVTPVSSAIWHHTVSSIGQNMTVGGSYSGTNSSLQIYNLPTTSVASEIVRINDSGTGRIRIGQAASQFIQAGSNVTTTGTGGYLQSTAKGDSITIETIVATNQWQVVAIVGNWTVV